MINILSRYTVLAILLLSVSLILRCGNEDLQVESEVHTDNEESKKEIVHLSPAEIIEFDIKLGNVEPGEVKVHLSIPGEIVIPPDNLAHIHPRFPGIVKKVSKFIGDSVSKGETLAIIEGNESLSEYPVISLIDGRVIEKHLTRGEVIDDSEHGFVVADLTEVWAELSLYQKDIPFVKLGQPVIISAGEQMPYMESSIDYISPIIDDASRTATARVTIQNSGGIWKPGLFVTGEIVTASKQVQIAVPRTSLQQFEGNTVVFVKAAEGFEPRPVSLGLSNDIMVEILSGLEVGETYVLSGGSTLKAELQKNEMNAGHGH